VEAEARHKKVRMLRVLIGLVGLLALALAGGIVVLALTPAARQHRAAAPRPGDAPSATGGVVCPLSGEPAPGGAVPLRPALAIKVDNYPAARPWSGIDHADIVYEEPVEGGITRFVAVFQCEGASLVGPVRSARAVDVGILADLSHPLFVHAGGITPVLSLLAAAPIHDENVFAHPSVIINPPGRVAPYDTYVSTRAAWALLPSDDTPPSPLFAYSAATPRGRLATVVHVPFSSTSDEWWRFDPAAGRYLLSYGNVPADCADGVQLTAANVLVQFVRIHYGPWYENSEGGLEVQATLTGTGRFLLFRNGVEVAGTWERPALGDPTELLGSDGAEVALAPGPTWVDLVPSTISVSVQG
jgi:hypothetical protein